MMILQLTYKTTTFTIPAGGAMVGATTGPAFVQLDGIAKRHLRVYLSGDEWFVAPMEGEVFLDGEPVKKPTALNIGGKISVGPHTLEVTALQKPQQIVAVPSMAMKPSRRRRLGRGLARWLRILADWLAR